MENIQPSLVEPGVKYFIDGTLQQCQKIKNSYYNTIFNIGLLLTFFVILGGILIAKYKGKLTSYEKQVKKRQQQEYILSKLKQVDSIKKHQSQQLITDLPNWSDNPELQVLNNRKIYR